jgi:3-phosphoshikimate 1-carboxyvinyltransferase
MRPFVVKPVSSLKGKVLLSGDKSITHRAVILSALSFGKTRIKNFPANKDCAETVNSFKKLGVKIKFSNGALCVYGKGLLGLKKPASPIFINESGTTLRLLLGVLAGQNFSSVLKAGKPLSKRPMLRVVTPLRKMGAHISKEQPPFFIQPSPLKGIIYKMPVASAQVKSALLLAGLYAKGKTKIIEPIPTRDHTERMLKLFRADIKTKGGAAIIRHKELVSPGEIHIPADISSAAFLIVAALCVAGSHVVIKDVSLNPSRGGALKVLKRMGADIRIVQRPRAKCAGEPMGDIIVCASPLEGTTVEVKEAPSLIDELPVLMAAAAVARGTTVFRGVGELRVKETDRIRSMVENLKKMGARIRVRACAGRQDVIIEGPVRLKGANVKSFGDHRTAMSLVVAGLSARGSTYLDDTSCIAKSFPEFLTVLNRLKGKSA